MVCLVVPMAAGDNHRYRSIVFEYDGTFPNNAGLPLIVLPQAFTAEALNPETIEALFEENGWDSA